MLKSLIAFADFDWPLAYSMAALRMSIALAIAFLTGCSSSYSITDQLATGRGSLPWIAAHRGLRFSAPDNSLDAIRNAIRADVPLIEIDVRRTVDGLLYLFHDRRLSAQNSSSPEEWWSREVSSLGASEVGRIKIPGTSDSPPSLRGALGLIRSANASFLLDLKGESPLLIAEVLAEVMSVGARRHVIVQCQSIDCVAQVRAAPSRFAVLYRAKSLAQLLEAVQYRPDILQGDYAWLDARAVEVLHGTGARVLVKSLGAVGDVAAVWCELRRRKVDIILTDYPVQLRQQLASCPLA